MKRLLLLILGVLLLLLPTQAHPQPPFKIGVLYLENNENLRDIGPSISALRDDESFSLHDSIKKGAFSTEHIFIESYRAGTLIDKYEVMIDSLQIDILIGPTTSASMKQIDEYHANHPNAKKPHIIAPTVSTSADEFPEIEFPHIRATNSRKVAEIWQSIINEYDFKEIGIFYENDTWGVNIVKEFGQATLDLNVLGKPFATADNSAALTGVTITRFIENLSNRDVRLVVIAVQDDNTALRFLRSLKQHNEKHFAEYRPIIVFFKNYNLGLTSQEELFQGLEIYGITEYNEVTALKAPESLALSTDAFKLAAELMFGPSADRASSDLLESFPYRFRSYLDGQTRIVDPASVSNLKFATLPFKEPGPDRSFSKKHMLMYKVVVTDSITKVGVDVDHLFSWDFRLFSAEGEFFGLDIPEVRRRFSGSTVRYVKAKLVPFWNFQNFPRRPLLFMIFWFATFLAFTIFMHSEYYTPLMTLLNLELFWIWFGFYSFLTTLTITVLLYIGVIGAGQLEIILLAGFICPAVINYLFKEASNIQIPFLTAEIQDFLNRLKESIDLEFKKIIPDNNTDVFLNHIDEMSTIANVRVAIYTLIAEMKSNSLTNKFSTDLKERMVKVDEMAANDKAMDDNMKETVMKKELIRFYLEILFFTSRDENTFRKRLIHSGLGQEGKLIQLLNDSEKKYVKETKEPGTDEQEPPSGKRGAWDQESKSSTTDSTEPVSTVKDENLLHKPSKPDDSKDQTDHPTSGKEERGAGTKKK